MVRTGRCGQFSLDITRAISYTYQHSVFLPGARLFPTNEDWSRVGYRFGEQHGE